MMVTALLLSVLPLTVGLAFYRPFMAVATVAYACFVMGILVRRRDRTRHLRWMIVGMLLDLAIVAVLEAQRHAVNTAIELSLTPLQEAHVVLSLVAVVLYLPLLCLGALSFAGRARALGPAWHRRLGITAFLCRTLGFLLMFSLLTKNN